MDLEKESAVTIKEGRKVGRTEGRPDGWALLILPLLLPSLHPPTLAHRGAFGAMGLRVADLLPQAGDELVVGTLSGDIIVYSIDPSTSVLTELWRTFVPGSAGCYQGIAVEDLDGDNKQELYVASSSGLYRFTQP